MEAVEASPEDEEPSSEGTEVIGTEANGYSRTGFRGPVLGKFGLGSIGSKADGKSDAMKRAVSLDNQHFRPYKRAKISEQTPRIEESTGKTAHAEPKEGSPVKPKPERVCSLLSAKSLPGAYDIRCYSLPVPFMSRDFLKSPVGSAPKLQIQPLDITVGLFPDGGSKTSSDWLKAPLKTKDTKDGGGKVAASLSQLHHSKTSSAFQMLSRQGSLNTSQAAIKAAQPQVRPPAFVPQPPKLAPSHQQRFSDAFQEAMKQHKQAEACAANRKAAILRFKAKRQQRSFEKKVRYASRKRLADQRPRIKGQFVKAADQQKSFG